MGKMRDRISALEATRQALPDPQQAHRLHTWCNAHGIDTPAPTPAQPLPAWLATLPAQTLRKMRDGLRTARKGFSQPA
ncbi:MAG: hypothetical protein RLZZ352_2176 [Pseudomonadota bacterium]|jgi:hypothetical protein